MGHSEVKVNKNGTTFLVDISGVIDEDMDFSPYSLSGATTVQMNLEGIKSINSCGIREWIKWIGTSNGANIEYKLCPKIIVDQINMVEGFLPQKGKVLSFYVPYFNDDSGEEKNVLFTYGKEYAESGLTPPTKVTDSSGNEMEMDVIEAKYFKFIKK